MNTEGVPQFTELEAPPHWRTVDFISDLHLQATDPATFDAWRAFMETTPADALFILGDLFEVWIGDDASAEPGFEADCTAVLRAAAARVPVFFMHGNRDFLAGDGLMRTSRMTMLDDPTVLTLHGQRWLLTHGDALCVGDRDYMTFRAKARTPQWQHQFLGPPLAERKKIGAGLRAESEQRKVAGLSDAEVDPDAVVAWLAAADARWMIHGHTHRPAAHDLGSGLRRLVLSDWDATASPPRLQVLRVGDAGPIRIALA